MFKAILYGILDGLILLSVLAIIVGGCFYIADAIHDRYNIWLGVLAGGIYVSIIGGGLLGYLEFVYPNNTDDEI